MYHTKFPSRVVGKLIFPLFISNSDQAQGLLKPKNPRLSADIAGRVESKIGMGPVFYFAGSTWN